MLEKSMQSLMKVFDVRKIVDRVDCMLIMKISESCLNTKAQIHENLN